MRWRPFPSEPGGRYWADWHPDDLVMPTAPQADRTENPVVATILGPDGKPLRQLLAREPIGYRPPDRPDSTEWEKP